MGRSKESMERRIAYSNEYNRNNYDRVSVIVPKGARAEYKKRAAKKNMSLSQYILAALDSYNTRQAPLDGEQKNFEEK